MNSAIKWHVCLKIVAALVFSLFGLGLAAPAQAQDGTVSPMTCAQVNETLAGFKFGFGPVSTEQTSTGETVTLGMPVPLDVAVGDTFTFTVLPGLTDDVPPDTAVATNIQWHLVSVDYASLLGATQLPPLTTVASGGVIGSTLTYTPSVAGKFMLAALIDKSDGFAGLTISCTHVAPPAVPGVKVDLDSLAPQTAAFPTGRDTLTFTFDISQDEKVKALLPGQSVTLPITAVVDSALLADACGCIANTLTTEVTYGLPALPPKVEPTPVPTVGEFALGALMLLVAAAAWRSGVGRQGLKALAVIGLGVGLMYPAHDLRAAGGNALDTITASLSGTTVTVTVKRNPNCVVNQPPALPSPIEFSFTLADVGFDPIGVVLPAASNVESETLTYGLSPLPQGWSFDAQTRTVSGLRDPANPYVFGYVCTSQPPQDNLAGFPLQLDYSVTDSCNRPVTVKLWCGAADGIPVGG